MVIPFKNTNLFYTSKGTGNPLVLLHGFLESGKIWENFSSEFSKDRQIITIDLPGHGNSGCVAEVHSMEIMAEAVSHILEGLKIEKADFVGHSMGGYVALAFLEKSPEKVNKLILLNSTPEADSEERKENRERAVELVQKNKPAYISMAISNLLPRDNREKFKKELELLKSEALKFPVEGITAALKGMKIRKDRTGILQEFKGEKFIIAGKKDPVLDYVRLEKIALQGNCTFTLFPDGHLSFLENQQELNKIVYFIE